MRAMNFSFNDERLNDRTAYCFAKLKKDPSLSFPQIFSEPKDLQAFYRLINNERTDLDDIKDAIFSDTKAGLAGKSEAIAIHDTTHISPTAKAQKIKEFKNSNGFYAHVSLLVDSHSMKRIHGPSGVHIWNRVKKSPRVGEEKEFNRWLKQVDEVEANFSDINLIHVMDREGDASSIWSEMHTHSRRFVIRVKSADRPVKRIDGEMSWLADEMRKVKPIASREVSLSKRAAGLPRARYNAREKRKTVLYVSAKSLSLQLRSPSGGPSTKTLNLNVVRVFEEAVYPSKDHVEWLLLTTEPIETVNQVLRVVDIYKSRWIIEEFFKGLKTGCRLEERLLDDADSWHKLVTLFLPVAASLLNMRLDREQTLDGRYFSETQIKILRMHAKENAGTIKNLRDAQLQMAKLGGHIPANGPPGWITLFRGYKQLIAMEQGWLLARGMKM